MRRVRLILQARMSSTRLPGKSLLPIRGIPVVALAAMRAARSRYELVVAIPQDSRDDVLEEALAPYAMSVIRGPLDDVLSRFVIAASGLPDDAVVVRLTADNVFPDAELVQEVLSVFARSGNGYLTTNSPACDIPYGLSVEVFTAGVLREAAEKAVLPYDREHVTPWIRRVLGVRNYRPAALPAGFGRLRCTIDTADDYHRVQRAFQGVEDPVGVPWFELCRNLAALPDAPCCSVPLREVGGAVHSTFVLGTAQLGMRYGIANRTGQPSEHTAVRIVRLAIDHGVTHLDTARAYGDSERRIGLALSGGWSGRVHVVTKVAPIEHDLSDAPRACLVNAVDASVFRSCRELGLARLDTVLIHRAPDRTRWGGTVWQRLLQLRREGIVGELGVSVETPEEARSALADPDVTHVQLPFNVLDWRWKAAGVHELARARPDVVVHARSALLQGLLAAEDPLIWPVIPGVNAGAILAKLHTLVSELGRKCVVDLALAYVRAHDWIHGVVVGVETVDQLIRNVCLFNAPALDERQVAAIERVLGDPVPVALLNPALWPR